MGCVPKHCPPPVPTNLEATVGMPKLPSRIFTSNPIIKVCLISSDIDPRTTRLVPKLQWKVAPTYWTEVQGREGRKRTARSTVVGSWTGQAEKFRKTRSNSSQVKVIVSSSHRLIAGASLQPDRSPWVVQRQSHWAEERRNGGKRRQLQLRMSWTTSWM